MYRPLSADRMMTSSTKYDAPHLSWRLLHLAGPEGQSWIFQFFFFFQGFCTAPPQPVRTRSFTLYFSAAHMKTDLPPSVRTKNGRVHRCSASFFAPVALWPGRIVIGSFKRFRFLYGRHAPTGPNPFFLLSAFFPACIIHT